MGYKMAFLGLLALAGGMELGGRSSEQTGGGSGPLPEPIFDGGATSGVDFAPPAEGGGCVAMALLGPQCHLAGGWVLTHSNPDQPCPFGASRHRIDLVATDQVLCLTPGEDFQMLELGTGAPCAVVLR